MFCHRGTKGLEESEHMSVISLQEWLKWSHTSVAFLTAARKLVVSFVVESVLKVPRALVINEEGKPSTKLEKV